MLQLLGMTEDQWLPWDAPEASRQKRGRPWLWIGLPIFLGGLIIAGAIYLVMSQAFGTARIWADVSLIVVLLPLCILGFIPLLILVALSYGVGRLVGWLPGPMVEADHLFKRMAREGRRGSDLAVQPLLILQGWLATAETFIRGLIGFLR